MKLFYRMNETVTMDTAKLAEVTAFVWD